MKSTDLEYQISALEKKLSSTPQFSALSGKQNSTYFALKNKIKSLKSKLIIAKQFEHLAR